MAFTNISKNINPRNYQNQANAIAAEAKQKNKSYWEIAQKYGHKIVFIPNKAWMHHLAYQARLEERSKNA